MICQLFYFIVVFVSRASCSHSLGTLRAAHVAEPVYQTLGHPPSTYFREKEEFLTVLTLPTFKTDPRRRHDSVILRTVGTEALGLSFSLCMSEGKGKEFQTPQVSDKLPLCPCHCFRHLGGVVTNRDGVPVLWTEHSSEGGLWVAKSHRKFGKQT